MISMRRDLIIAISVSSIAILMGALTTLGFLGYIYVPWVGARVKNVEYEIAIYGGAPTLVVRFSTNVYPVDVILLGPGPKGPRTELDRVTVYSSQDIPARLFFSKIAGHPIPGYNVPAGTYYLMFMYKGDVLLEQKIDLQGPVLTIKSAELFINFTIYWTQVGWRIETITLTATNVGDCPAFINWIKLYVYELDKTLNFKTETAIEVGETSTFTARYWGFDIPIQSPGIYHAKIIVSLGTANFTYETSFTTTAPQLELVEAYYYYYYYPDYDKYVITQLDITIKNTGPVPAYIFSITVVVNGASDTCAFSLPQTVRPGQTITLTIYISLIVYGTGVYDANIIIDLGVTTVSFSGQIELTPP
ncbi:MAG: hypothetical protein DRJ98_08275 [Thermoprotei archaeon]|nr:MAG: hypothetical protein DRJ98_08275 [Thermoprotei archaeon]